jgi:glycosyltransferase involved in cell wall biosynthesis
MTMASTAVLVATRNRSELLRQRTVPSIMHQELAPSVVLVVNDGDAFPPAVCDALASIAGIASLQVLPNERAPGPAGAWITGLQWLRAHGFDGFVAILDDDDTWEPQHLAANLRAASAAGATLAVTGLRLQIDGRLEPRPLLSRLVAADFLVGNPGWQGSNTFVRMEALEAVGGFDEQLPSMHDRDLAVRLLRKPGVSGVLVPEWTATWFFGTPGCLTARSEGKLIALQRFLAKHGALMNLEERAAYFERAHRMFGFTQAEIECRSD